MIGIPEQLEFIMLPWTLGTIIILQSTHQEPIKRAHTTLSEEVQQALSLLKGPHLSL